MSENILRIHFINPARDVKDLMQNAQLLLRHTDFILQSSNNAFDIFYFEKTKSLRIINEN